jgi:hypothetical protein
MTGENRDPGGRIGETARMHEPGTILVTGGAGYIGSHTVRALRTAGREVVVLDSLELGDADAVIDAPIVQGDIADGELVGSVLRDFGVSDVVHFAAYKSVGESMESPASIGATTSPARPSCSTRAGAPVSSSSCSRRRARCTARPNGCR